MGPLQRNPNCGYKQSGAGSSSTQAQKFGVSDHLLLGSLPLSIFLWTWRANGGTTAREDILPTRSVTMMLCQELSTWQSSFRHHKSCGITGTLILARSIVDVVMEQNRINLSTALFPGWIDRASLHRSSTDHKSVPPCLPACLPASQPGAHLKKSVFRFWSPATNIAANVM